MRAALASIPLGDRLTVAGLLALAVSVLAVTALAVARQHGSF